VGGSGGGNPLGPPVKYHHSSLRVAYAVAAAGTGGVPELDSAGRSGRKAVALSKGPWSEVWGTGGLRVGLLGVEGRKGTLRGVWMDGSSWARHLPLGCNVETPSAEVAPADSFRWGVWLGRHIRNKITRMS